PALIGLDAREEIEPGLEPRRESLGDLERLVERVLGWPCAVGRPRRAENRHVAVELDHRGARGDRFRAVDLNLEVALGVGTGGGEHQGGHYANACNSSACFRPTPARTSIRGHRSA